MRKKTISLICVMALLLSFVLTGCQKEDPTSVEPTQTQNKETQESVSSNETETNIETNMETTPSETSEPQEIEPVSVPAPSFCGALHVEGTQLVDKNGNPVQLKGISTAGLSWFPEYVNEECFKQLHEKWGVSVMRLAMYTAEYAGYCNGGDQEQLKELIKNGVDYATNQDMYVIVDWHILSDGNPNEHIEESKAFFEEISSQYADSDNVIYELCNEPNGNDVNWSTIKSYAEQIIPIIRAHDEDALILVGNPQWSQLVDQAAADPITDYDNIMYTLHFYAATHKEWLQDTLAAAQDAGLPIFVSEYGICEASGNGMLDKESAQKWIDLLNERNISYVAWTLSNKDESGAIVSSGCNKYQDFELEDLSEYGQWLYKMFTEGSTK